VAKTEPRSASPYFLDGVGIHLRPGLHESALVVLASLSPRPNVKTVF
jgi:hypothetical protein